LSEPATRVRAPVSERKHPSHLQPTQARPESESVYDQQTHVPSERVATDPAPGASSEAGAPGTFNDEGVYTPRQVVADDLGVSFDEAVASTMVEVEDGQIVHGRVVKI